MRKGLFFSSLAIALLSGAALVAYLLAPVSRAIRGHVLRGGEGKNDACADAKVVLKREGDPNFRQVARTDAKGWFSFAELPDGLFRLSVELPDGSVDEVERVARGTHVTLHPAKP